MGPVHRSESAHEKIASIRSSLRDNHDHASDGLQVIMDFDLTMTAPGSEQCHHMFETSLALPEELRGRLAPYFSGTMEFSSREDWWDRFHAVLVEARLTRAQVTSVANGADITLRHGTGEFIRLLHKRRVPLLIVSAGITNIVEETLRGCGLLLDNVKIHANTMVFGQDGRLEGFGECPPVHSRNKYLTAERESAYFKSHPKRHFVVVVGDKPGDADVSDGLAPDARCLKIGFFDHSREHPHPDLPPLPPLTAADEGDDALSQDVLETLLFSGLSEEGGSGVDNSHAAGAVGFGFLREEEAPPLEFPPAAVRVEDSGGAVVGQPRLSSQERVVGRPGSQGGGDVYHPSANGGGVPSSLLSPPLGVEEEEGTRVGKPLRGATDQTSSTAAPRPSSIERPPSYAEDKASGGDEGAELEGSERGPVGMSAEEILLVYRERFDVVACGGHSMDLVADFVLHVIDGVVEPGSCDGDGAGVRPPARR